MKLFRLTLAMLIALTASFAMTSCDGDDDKNMPDVSISLSYGDNATAIDHEVYIVQGNDLVVTGVYVKANRPGKTATIGPVTYSLNGIIVGYNPVAPFGITVPMATLTPGKYILTLGMSVAEVHCELAQSTAQVPVNIVASESDIPSNPNDDGAEQHAVRFSLQ